MNRQASSIIGIMVENDLRRIPALQMYTKHKPNQVKLVSFTPVSIDWKHGQVRGLHFKNRRWMEDIFPLPRIVYNRCYRLDSTFRNRLNESLGPNRWFNQINEFNKLETYRCLSRWLSPHLPITQVFDKEVLTLLLHEHKVLFLKPQLGNLGQGVYRVELKDCGEIHVADHHLKPRIIASSFSSLQEEIEPLIGSTAYLIQQGVQVKLLGLRHFDIRVLAQKNRTGQWSVTNVVSRVAYSGCFNTSVCEKVILTKEALKELFPAANIKKLMNTIYNLSLRAAEIIETDTANHLCELSVDMALDRKGHLWIIEMNGKPHKGLYDDLPQYYKTVYSKPLEYANYIRRHSC